jgi:menaquinone-9 beta-reductase
MDAEKIHRVAVCIIGAGPAGSAASLTLSRKGISHLVIEADQFPRNKPCGDILTSGAVRALGRLEPTVLEELGSRGLLNPIWHTSTYGPGGRKISIAFRPLEKGTQKPGCYAVNRWDLDEAMYRRISAWPEAEVWTGVRAQKISYTPDGILLETQCGRRVEARCLLMATGSSNGLLKELGLRQEKQDAAVGIRQHFEGIETRLDHTELYLLNGKMPGGLYITPLGNGLFNVNLVLSLQKVNQEKINLRESLEQAIQQIPILQQKFAHARAVGSPEGSQCFWAFENARQQGIASS